MSPRPRGIQRVLAIDPTSRGFGFIVMEGRGTPVDWGVKTTRVNKESETVAKVKHLIRHYRAHVLVFEDCRAKGSRRCVRIQRLLGRVHAAALKEGTKSRRVSQLAVQKVFLAFRAKTKHQIAQAIAAQIPELAPHVPRYRKPWMSENYRTAIFDAAAFALTYFYSRPVRSQSSK